MKFPIEWEKLYYYLQHIFLCQTFFFQMILLQSYA